MPTIDDRIRTIDGVIYRYLDTIDTFSRGVVSQDILSNLQKLVTHIMLKFYSGGSDIEINALNIQKALEFCQTTAELKSLYRFYNYLDIVVAHYTLDEDGSERLMLKYYQYLLEIKSLMQKHWNFAILSNLNKFPLNLDTALQEYYEKIAQKIEKYPTEFSSEGSRYYIQKMKPFFVNGKIYHEVTFTPANDKKNKSNRIIAFTKLPITGNYASKFKVVNETVNILEREMPVVIIVGWEVAIRGCEFKNFISVVTGEERNPNFHEQSEVCRFLTATGYTLTELMDFPEHSYQAVIDKWSQNSRTTIFIDVLKKCRNIIQSKSSGQNLLRYLLYNMNNVIIKNQRIYTPNSALSNLYFHNGCRPFERMPFIQPPKGHTPKLRMLLSCIPTKDRKHELLAKLIRNNTEMKGCLFTPLSEITGYDNIPLLAKEYNDRIWFGHLEKSRLVIENDCIYMNGFKDDTCQIIAKLRTMAASGLENYAEGAEFWVDVLSDIDCPEKKEIIKHLFVSSKVAVIYGAAGVGKSTLVNHISQYFDAENKLYLAHTNSAVNNLKRRVTSNKKNCTFSTIASFTNGEFFDDEYDLLVIDECSTVDNENMLEVLNRAKYKLILLVGDTYQIDSIRFGNWFSALRSFITESSVYELTKPYRTTNPYLLNLWSKVRCMDDKVQELIEEQSGSLKVDNSLLTHVEEDEAVLCLNYDGLYGINNINRFLQESNPNPAVHWGIQLYKIGDPILFTDTERFFHVIYNNLKGRIIGIEIINPNEPNARIQFDIEVEKSINENDAFVAGLELIESSEKKSVIRFSVYKNKDDDEEDDASTSVTIVPFQVAYAVSIHKAQGLEYDSVKLVITDEVDELITHNIFYTAITRARKKLKIYWTPEVEVKVISSIKPRNIERDIEILGKYLN